MVIKSYALAIWIVYSTIALFSGWILYAGPSVPPPDTPQWIIYATNFAAYANCVVLIIAAIYALAKELRK